MNRSFWRSPPRVDLSTEFQRGAGGGISDRESGRQIRRVALGVKQGFSGKYSQARGYIVRTAGVDGATAPSYARNQGGLVKQEVRNLDN